MWSSETVRKSELQPEQSCSRMKMYAGLLKQRMAKILQYIQECLVLRK